MDSRPANLIVVCLNCHSEVERKGGLGRAYSPGELQRYKESALREIAMRRKRAKGLDQSLALFEVKRLTYKFQALDFHGKDEPRALELMRLVMQFGRDGGYEAFESSGIEERRALNELVSEAVARTAEAKSKDRVRRIARILANAFRSGPKENYEVERELIDAATQIAESDAYILGVMMRHQAEAPS